MGKFDQQKEYERERFRKFIDEMLDHVYDEANDELPESLRIDTFGIVAVYLWDDEEGDTFEGTAAYTESKKHYVARGIFERALDRVKSAVRTDNAW